MNQKRLISLCANQKSLSASVWRFYKNDSDSSHESFNMTRVESSHLIKNVTRVESSQETAERDSIRVRITKNRDSSRFESLTRVTTSLPFAKILCLTDLTQKLLSLRIFSYLCAEIVSLRTFS